MSLSASSLDSVYRSVDTREEFGIAVLKKAQDQAKQQATALIESIVLGNGGSRHTETLRALVHAGANVNIADRNGQTPLALARARNYKNMVQILEKAGAK